MRQILALTFLEIKKVFIKPSSYILMFGMPLLFTLIFGNLMGGGESESTLKLGFVNEDHSTLSTSIMNKMSEQHLFSVEEMSIKKAKEMVDSQKIVGFVYVRNGFEQAVLSNHQPTIKFLHSPAFTSTIPIIQTMNDILGQMNVSLTGASLLEEMHSDKNWQQTFKSIDNQLVSNKQDGYERITVNEKEDASAKTLSHAATGMSIMFVMFSIVSVTGVILEARKIGVWYRLLTTPASKFQIIAGYFIAFFLIGWIQFGMLLVATKIIFGIHWGDPIGLMILISALLLFVVGLGLFLAGIVKTTEQQGAIGSLVIVSSCMISGIYWPLEIVPTAMRKLAQFSPLTWAMKGFTEIAEKGGSLGDILLPVLVLLLAAIVLLGIGMRQIKFE